MPDEHADQTVLILQGGTDGLQLEDGGKVYRPGDPMPKNLAHARVVALQAAGIRFETVHAEPVLTPEGNPAEMAAAAQIDPPPGGPAVVAAIQDVPKTEASDEPSPSRATRGR